MNTLEQSQNELWKVSPVMLALAVAACGVLIIPFYDALSYMVWDWSNKEEYSHGFLLPFISIFLIYQRRNELMKQEFNGSWLGVILTLVGLFVYLMGELSTLYSVVQYAFLITVSGLLLSYVGWQSFKGFIIPLMILVLMIPLPHFLYNNLSSELQLISSEIGVFVIRLFDIPVYLQGNVIDLGVMKLQVVEACSGLRYLFPLMTIGFIMAYFYQGSIIFRAVVFFSTIPITVLMNSIRIGLIGVSVEYWGQEMAEGILHDFEGWIVFMSCFFILVGEIWLFSYLIGEKKPIDELFAIDLPETLEDDVQRKARPIPTTIYASLAALVLVSLASTQIAQRAENIPDRKNFATFPIYVDQWRGRNVAMEQQYIDTLRFEDYIISNFDDGRDNLVNFYVAYYESQRKGESAHSPRSCLPGDGWRIESLSQTRIPEAEINGQPLMANRVIMRKGDSRSIVYYWFQQRGRVITNEYLVKWYLFWDSLTKNRTDGALVRLVADINDMKSEEELRSKEASLQQFAYQVSGILQEYVPN